MPDVGRLGSLNRVILMTTAKTEKLTIVHKYLFKQKLRVLKGSLI